MDVTDRAPLLALVEQWRAESADEAKRFQQYCYGGELDGDMLDGDIEMGLASVAAVQRCADQLAAVLNGRRA